MGSLINNVTKIVHFWLNRVSLYKINNHWTVVSAAFLIPFYFAKEACLTCCLSLSIFHRDFLSILCLRKDEGRDASPCRAVCPQHTELDSVHFCVLLICKTHHFLSTWAQERHIDTSCAWCRGRKCTKAGHHWIRSSWGFFFLLKMDYLDLKYGNKFGAGEVNFLGKANHKNIWKIHFIHIYQKLGDIVLNSEHLKSTPSPVTYCIYYTWEMRSQCYHHTVKKKANKHVFQKVKLFFFYRENLF